MKIISIGVPLVIGVILGAASVVFFLQNMTVITVSFMWWDFTASIALVVFATFFIGLLTVSAMLAPRLIREQVYLAALKRQTNVHTTSESVGSRDPITA